MHPTDRGPTRYSWLLTAAPSLLYEGEATTTQVSISPSHSPDKRGACQASTKLAWRMNPWSGSKAHWPSITRLVQVSCTPAATHHAHPRHPCRATQAATRRSEHTFSRPHTPFMPPVAPGQAATQHRTIRKPRHIPSRTADPSSLSFNARLASECDLVEWTAHP